MKAIGFLQGRRWGILTMVMLVASLIALAFLIVFSLELGQSERHLQTLKLTGWTTYSLDSPSTSVNDIRELDFDHQGRLWAGTDAGLVILDKGEHLTTYTRDNSDLISNSIYALIIDDQGDAWIGTAGGLNKLAIDGSWETYTPENAGPFIDSSIRALAIHNMDQLWIAHSTGLAMMPPKDDDSWFVHSGSAWSTSVAALAIDSEGRVWVGGDGTGLIRIDTNGNRKNYDIPGDEVLDLAIDDQNTVWLATDFGGPISVDPKSGIWKSYKDAKVEGARIVAVDHKNQVWAGGSGGISMLVPDGRWMNYNSSNSRLPDNNVSVIAFDDQNRLWIAHSGGIMDGNRKGGSISMTAEPSLLQTMLPTITRQQDNIAALQSRIKLTMVTLVGLLIALLVSVFYSRISN